MRRGGASAVIAAAVACVVYAVLRGGQRKGREGGGEYELGSGEMFDSIAPRYDLINKVGERNAFMPFSCGQHTSERERERGGTDSPPDSLVGMASVLISRQQYKKGIAGVRTRTLRRSMRQNISGWCYVKGVHR